MTEWILSSCILILAVIILRSFFRSIIRPTIQYALWGLVLLRLLIPFSIGSTGFSVSNLLPATAPTPVMQTGSAQVSPVPQVSQEVPPETLPKISTVPESVSAEPSGIPWLRIIWTLGAIASATAFFLSNLRFRRGICVSRRKLSAHGVLNVYVTGGTDTPCLFGLVHPVIYIPPDVADDPTLLRHSLAHELTHFRHGDHIWGALRCLCLVIHWYNPLVWWAAALSRQDGELACDEATIRSLGEEERAAYGKTLIFLTCHKPSNPLVAATTMTSNSSNIKERILRIAQAPRMALYTLVILLLAAAIAVGCTFTGGKVNFSDTSAMLEYSYRLVQGRMEQEDVRFLGSVGDYHLIHCTGEGPMLILYRTEIQGSETQTTGFAVGDYAISAGLSVNHIQDGDRHIYFGTVSDSHWIPGTDSSISLDWAHLVFYDSEGAQSSYDIPDTTGFLFVLDSPVSDFWVVTKDGNIPLKMQDYLSQGYPITEVSFRAMPDSEDTQDISENARTVIHATMNTPNPDLFVPEIVVAIGTNASESQEQRDSRKQLQQQIDSNWEAALGHCFSPGSFDPFRRTVIATQFFVESFGGLGESRVLSMVLISRDDTREVVQVEVQTGELLRTFQVTFRYNPDGLFYRVEISDP